jgi:tetratricopeptide (TPR) repeat protein
VAVVVLNDAPACKQFFRHRILSNLQFWLDLVAARPPGPPGLDGERDAIVKAISFGLEVEEAWADVYDLIVACSSAMERSGYWAVWGWLLGRATESARRAADPAGEAAVSTLAARLLQWQGRFHEAAGCYRRAIRLSRRVGDAYNEARACSNLGYIYIEKGFWRRAEVLSYHALDLFERLDSNHGRAHTENHLGMLYTWQRAWDAARRCLERACALWQAMDDRHGLMRGTINLGVLYIEMQHPQEALEYLEQACELAAQTGEETELARIYTNMGVAQRIAGRPAEAEALGWQAEAIFRRLSNSLGLAQVWGNLGLACLDQARWEDARAHLEASLVAWRALQIRYGEIRTLLYMARYQIVCGNRAEAARQLDGIERLMGELAQDGQYQHLRPLLDECRRDLAEDAT